MPAGTLLYLREHTCPYPYASLCLTRDRGLFRVPFRSRAPPPTSWPPSSPPPRVSLPRACPILRPRAGLPLTQGPVTLRSPRASEPHSARDSPPPRGTLFVVAVCVEILQAPFELSAACGPISPCCRIHTPPEPLFFSLVRRMIAMLINFVAEKTNASAISSVALSPDGTRIVSGSDDGTIKVWDLGVPRAQNRPSSAKTNACWLVWQTNWRC